MVDRNGYLANPNHHSSSGNHPLTASGDSQRLLPASHSYNGSIVAVAAGGGAANEVPKPPRCVQDSHPFIV